MKRPSDTHSCVPKAVEEATGVAMAVPHTSNRDRAATDKMAVGIVIASVAPEGTTIEGNKATADTTRIQEHKPPRVRHNTTRF